MPVCRSKMRTSGIHLFYSLPIILKQGLFLTLGLLFSQLDWKPEKFNNLSVSILSDLGLQAYKGCWDPNYSPHDCMAGSWSELMRHLPNPFHLGLLKQGFSLTLELTSLTGWSVGPRGPPVSTSPAHLITSICHHAWNL